jgi:predicted AlkP superfamily pyrophosphatase or phosphodiesterase
VPKRVLLLVAVCAVLAVPAAYLLRPDPAVPGDAPTLDAMADAVGAPVMEHIWRGHVPGRSAEIMLVPKPHRFLIGEWPLTTLGTATPEVSTAHPNPWDYLARVPLIFYGPGYIEAGLTVDDPVDIADVAPTYAELLGIDLDADGAPLDAMQAPRRKPPKVIFTVVIDGGGWNALQEHPDSWPTIDRLQDHGTSYVNATIGSAPSITGALHPTFGTGSYPMNHGIPGNQMRGPNGNNTDTWRQEADPRYLELPTVAELWDEANSNDAIVATVSFEGWHLGMIGHGAQRPGGDKDIAVLWEVLDNAWWINEDYYTLPSYLQTTDLERLESYEAQLDGRDGLEDGSWFGHTLDDIQDEDLEAPRDRSGSPAFVRFTGDAIVDILRNEPFGADGITDFFWVEMKMPDYAGHLYNMLGPEQADVIRETDRQIARFKNELDRLVGEDQYVLAISADHGQQPLPDVVGGWRVNNVELQRDIEDRFGDVIEKITPVDIYVDVNETDEGELTEIARYIGTYTIGENIPEDAPGADRVPDARLDELLFVGAFPTGYLQALTPARIQSFGDSDYAEGEFTPAPRGQG